MERFNEFEAKIRRILDMFPQDGRPMPRSDHRPSQELLGELKDELRAERERRDFSPLEAKIFEPAIKRTAAHLTIRRTSTPDRKWVEKLGEARQTLSLARYKLEQMIAGEK
ncbi:MAG: hypothetical protein ABSD63_17510 [Candidatus Korobacteraceae bacterium]